MWDDLRHAVRSLRARPGPSAVAVLCLGLGLGVNVALFGVVDALLLRPPEGVVDAHRLVRVRIGTPGDGALSRGFGSSHTWPQFEEIAAQERARLTVLAAYARADATLDGGSDARPLSVVVASQDYFRVLGARPVLGRFFEAVETAPGSGFPVTVVSHRFWERVLGGNPDVLGRVLRVNGALLTVVGVAPAGFVGVDLGEPDLWIPAGLAGLPEFGGPGRYAAGTYWLQLVGRLRTGVSSDQASAPVALEMRPFQGEPSPRLPVVFSPLRTRFYEDHGGRSPVSAWVLGVSATVLLLACATVANLLLAQAVGRRRDVAIRLAVGGSPARIVRQHLLESFLLALVGLGAAAVLARSGSALLTRLPVPPTGGVVNVRSLAAGLAAALLTPFVFGVVPAVWAARREVSDILRSAGGGRGSVSRMLRGFMMAQTALGFVLLVVAGLFVGSLKKVQALDSGMDVDRLLVVWADPRSGGAGTVEAELGSSALERVRRLPGVESAALGVVVPFFLYRRGSFHVADGRPDEEQPDGVLVNEVSPGYLATLGIALVEGRDFAREDAEGEPRVALVSERLARELWGGRTPLGACLRLSASGEDDCVEVVGVAADAHYEELTGEPSSMLYLPASPRHANARSLALFVRSRQEVERLIPAVRAEVQSLDPSMPFLRIESLDARARPQRLRWEVAGKVFSALGGLAALLAAVGLFMVVSFTVSRDRRELGIRAALGAERWELVLLVLGRGLAVSLSGIAVGVLVGAPVARLFRSELYGLGPAHAPTWLAVAGGLTVVALLASLGPALGASRVDPGVVLREE